MTHENCSVGGTVSDCACVHIHADFEVPISCLARAKKNILKRSGKKEGGEGGDPFLQLRIIFLLNSSYYSKKLPRLSPPPVDLNRKQP